MRKFPFGRPTILRLFPAALAVHFGAAVRAQNVYPTPFKFTVFAGATNTFGTMDGTGSGARFNSPMGLAFDIAGNLYVADSDNHTIRKVTPEGVVTTIAGKARDPGYINAVGTAAQFFRPTNVAVDGSSNIFVADTTNNVIRMIATYGGTNGLAVIGPMEVIKLMGDPALAIYQNGPIASAYADHPTGLAVSGMLLVGSGPAYIFFGSNFNGVRKIDPARVVSNLAGGGASSTADGTGTAAGFRTYPALAADASGNVFVADTNNHTIRKISLAGTVTTIAGSAGFAGSADGTGATARFRFPSAVAVTPAGDVIYVADSGNRLVRKVLANGVVTTLAGSPTAVGSIEGSGSGAGFYNLQGIAIDPAGAVYVADATAHTISKGVPAALGSDTALIVTQPISQTVERRDRVMFSVETLRSPTSSTTYQWRYEGSAIPGATTGVYVIPVAESSRAGNYTVTINGGVATSRPAVLTVVPSTQDYGSRHIFTTFSGGSSAGSINGALTDARYNYPTGIAIDRDHNLYVADRENFVIRKISATGVVSTFAGRVGVSGHADGSPTTALFRNPVGIDVDAAGVVYVSDGFDYTVRKISSSAFGSFGTVTSVTTLAGSSTNSGTADGSASNARFGRLGGLKVDSAGNVYVADTGNDTIRKITAAGVVTTIAGKPGLFGNTASVDGAGANGHFYGPSDVAVDLAGNIFVADGLNHTIRKITFAGAVTTLAGLARNPGNADGTGRAARFNAPQGIALDAFGNLFVTDSGNNVVRKVTPAGVVTTVAGFRGMPGSDDGAGSFARFNTPAGITIDRSGTGVLYVTDSTGYNIRRGVPGGGDEPGPAIAVPPLAQNVPNNGAVTFSVQATSTTAMTYQWYRDGQALGGGTDSSLTIGNLNAGYNGNYSVVVTNLFGSTTSAAAALTVGPAAGRIVNLSILTALTADEPAFKVGTVLGGSGTRGSKDLVIRAVGPSLAAFGLDGVLADPKIAIFASASSDGAPIDGNDNWAGDAGLRNAMARVGAFDFGSADSRDAAIAPSFAAGGYVVEVRGVNGATGTVLAELYDATLTSALSSSTPRLVNVSVLKSLGAGIVAGVVIAGEAPKTVLVRAIGPGLTQFGLTGTLPDPRLTLYDQASRVIATNDNWSGTPELSAAFGAVGAFVIDPASKDAALLTTLAPGNYTIAVGGTQGTNGSVLVEVYEVP